MENLIVGIDGVVRGAKLRAGKSYMERAIQQLYPLELSCDRQMPAPQAGMNPEAAPYRISMMFRALSNQHYHHLFFFCSRPNVLDELARKRLVRRLKPQGIY